MRVGRIPYINCYPVYGAVDRGIVPMAAELVDGVPTALNKLMADGAIDVSVVSAVEYARDWERYLLLPDLAIRAFTESGKYFICESFTILNDLPSV